MIETRISRTTRARYWGDDSPPEFLIDSTESIVVRSISAEPSRLPALTAAIELAAIAGPRTLYGLLGATYMPSSGTQLVVEFHVGTGSGDVVSPLLTDERPIIGLPDWAISGIVDVVLECARKSSPQAGRLSFCLGAYSDLGSNISTFEKLAMCVIDILFSGRKITAANELTDVVRKHWS